MCLAAGLATAVSAGKVYRGFKPATVRRPLALLTVDLLTSATMLWNSGCQRMSITAAMLSRLEWKVTFVDVVPRGALQCGHVQCPMLVMYGCINPCPCNKHGSTDMRTHVGPKASVPLAMPVSIGVAGWAMPWVRPSGCKQTGCPGLASELLWTGQCSQRPLPGGS